MLKKAFLFAVILPLLSILLTQCGKKNDVVAKVENMEIRMAEFRDMVHQRYNTTKLDEITYEQKLEAVNALIDRRIKLLKAKEMGLHKDEEYLKERRQKEDRLIAQQLFIELVAKPMIPDDLLPKFNEWQQTNVKVAGIFIKYQGIRGYTGSRSQEEAFKLAKESEKALRNAENPEEIVLKYSEDPSVNSNRGIVNVYPLGQLGLDTDRQVLEASIGETVGPAETVFGYAVFKILNKEKNPRARSIEPGLLRQHIYRTYFNEEGQQRYTEMTGQLKEKQSARIHRENIQKFHDLILQWAKKQGPEPRLTDDEREWVLASTAGMNFTAGDFIDQFKGQFAKNYPRFSKIEALENAVNSQLDFMVWIAEARDRGIHQSAEVKKEMAGFDASYLSNLLEKHFVQKEVTVSEKEIMEYYQTHWDQYIELPRIRLFEIAVKDEELAEEIYRRARNGEKFEDLARNYTEKTELKNVGGDMGYLTPEAKLGEVIKKAFEAGPNQLIKPFAYGPYYYVLKTGELLPAQEKPFDGVRSAIEARLRKEKEKQVRESLLKDLRKEYVYRINESLIRRMT